MVVYDDFFKELTLSKNREDLENLFGKYNISGRNREKYPDLIFNINFDEIKELKSKGIITKDNNINSSFPEKDNLTTLERLFYAVMWKNGDLVKVKHIISGICGESTTSKVFNQFGKHLSNKEEVIIDQHVLRAFIFYKDGNVIRDIKNKHYDIYFNDYKIWIEKSNLFKNNKNIIDELLFGIGKNMKSKE